jgi:hypothetical protein
MRNIYSTRYIKTQLENGEPGVYVEKGAELSNFRRLGSTYTLKAIATAAGAFAFFTLGPVLPGLIAAGVTAFSFSKLANAHYNAYDSLSSDEDFVPFSFGKAKSKNAIVNKIEIAINFLQLATYKASWEAMRNGVIAKKEDHSKFYQLGVVHGESEKMMFKEMLGYDLLGAAISILLFVFVPAVGAGSIMAKLAAATLPVLLTGRLADYAKSRGSDSDPLNIKRDGKSTHSKDIGAGSSIYAPSAQIQHHTQTFPQLQAGQVDVDDSASKNVGGAPKPEDGGDARTPQLEVHN